MFTFLFIEGGQPGFTLTAAFDCASSVVEGLLGPPLLDTGNDAEATAVLSEMLKIGDRKASMSARGEHDRDCAAVSPTPESGGVDAESASGLL